MGFHGIDAWIDSSNRVEQRESFFYPNAYHQFQSVKENTSVTVSIGDYTNAWYIYEIQWLSMKTQLSVNDNTVAAVTAVSAIPALTNLRVLFGLSRGANAGNAHIYIDWIFVRKLASPEPTTSLGGEERPISKIVFTTSTQTITAGAVSAVMTIQTQDAYNNPVNVSSNTTINLSSTSGTGRFDTSATGSFNGSVTSVTINAGSNSASFYYKDTTSGTPTITASYTGWTSGTQQQTINPPPPRKTVGLPLPVSMVLARDPSIDISQTGQDKDEDTYVKHISSNRIVAKIRTLFSQVTTDIDFGGVLTAESDHLNGRAVIYRATWP